MPPVNEPDEAPPRLAKRAKVKAAEPPSPPRPYSDTRKWKKFPVCAAELPAEPIRVDLRRNRHPYSAVSVTATKLPSVFVLEDSEFSTQPKFITNKDFRELKKIVTMEDVSCGVGPRNEEVSWLHTATLSMSLTDRQKALRPQDVGSIKYFAKRRTAQANASTD